MHCLLLFATAFSRFSIPSLCFVKVTFKSRWVVMLLWGWRRHFSHLTCLILWEQLFFPLMTLFQSFGLKMCWWSGEHKTVVSLFFFSVLNMRMIIYLKLYSQTWFIAFLESNIFCWVFKDDVHVPYFVFGYIGFFFMLSTSINKLKGIAILSFFSLVSQILMSRLKYCFLLIEVGKWFLCYMASNGF